MLTMGWKTTLRSSGETRSFKAIKESRAFGAPCSRASGASDRLFDLGLFGRGSISLRVTVVLVFCLVIVIT